MDLILENTNFAHLLKSSAEHHQHVCPRQVIGVRMGLYAGQILGPEVPQTNKRLFTFIETDGCTLDGVVAGTGCAVGRRTMYIYDYGKIAATFVDQETGKAIRIVPNPLARSLCPEYAPEVMDHWHAYVYAYQIMPLEKLFIIQPVQLTVSMQAIISLKGARAVCDACGEEIFNSREVILNGKVLCRSCAGQGYYVTLPPQHSTALPEDFSANPQLVREEDEDQAAEGKTYPV